MLQFSIGIAMAASVETPESIQRFDSERIDQYQADEGMLYDKKVERDGGLWAAFMHWLSGLFSPPEELPQGEIPWSKYFNYLIIATFLGLAAFGLFRLNFKPLVVADAAKVGASLIEIEEDIEGVDLEVEIKKALESGDLRRAIRLYYLYCLQQMSLSDMIDWQANKTNQEYIKEIEDKSVAKEFQSLTAVFDYVWYGDFPINEESFLFVRQRFEHFKTLIHLK
ncbi:DUF4129 domain-containing protein [Chitinophagales bacterium]|nr:DUF4129 domain-containing protein [Chitinophagales bacterium]